MTECRSLFILANVYAQNSPHATARTLIVPDISASVGVMRILELISAALLTGLIGTFATLTAADSLPPQPSLTLDGQCVRVIDGDTIVVETRTQYHVRLIDCWAPESRTSDVAEKQRGLKAKNRMVQLADGKPVRVSIPLTSDLGDATTMGRVLGRVWVNDDGIPAVRDLSQQMVSEGLATRFKESK